MVIYDLYEEYKEEEIEIVIINGLVVNEKTGEVIGEVFIIFAKDSMRAVFATPGGPTSIKGSPLTSDVKVAKISVSLPVNMFKSLFLISIIGFKSNLYIWAIHDPKIGDIAIVIRLKKRLDKPEDVKSVTENDIEFIFVEYHEY